MIKEALQYIVGLQQPNLMNIDGKEYSDKPLYEIKLEEKPIYPNPLELTTLTSFVDFIKANHIAAPFVSDAGDCENAEHHYVKCNDLKDAKTLNIHIINHKTVSLYGELDKYGKRKNFAFCKAQTPEFDFNTFMSKENFIIGLQSLFVAAGDRAELLRIVGTLKQTDIKINNDDGITQNVKTTKGIVSGVGENIKNPVILSPFRTFIEVNQPSLSAIVRLKEVVNRYSQSKDEKEIQVGLFEADGGVWKLEAVDNIKTYLEKSLKGYDVNIFA